MSQNLPRIETWDINRLHNWEKNPRGIMKDDFDRLVYQIDRLGVYKPLLITEDGTVIGGNMRLRALKVLNYTKALVSIVDAPDDAKKTEYALSDNDRAGYYEEDALAELVSSVSENIDIEAFKVDLGELTPLGDVLKKLGPADQPPPQVDDKIQCPRCGFEFERPEDV